MTRQRMAAWRAWALMVAEQKYDYSEARQTAIDDLLAELEAEKAESRAETDRMLAAARAEVGV